MAEKITDDLETNVIAQRHTGEGVAEIMKPGVRQLRGIPKNSPRSFEIDPALAWLPSHDHVWVGRQKSD